ncbi:SIS domain-containing protein [Neobacillus cucumis]|uniref:SIS domain-containing protein n=1 Tax=Neobacillus cucumis TaxID=1740721 RepID=UPI0020410891|nr:SIS domain-containing protein [Neobacillus cucumis]MCM3727435.1 SIS domain-containing protein [Neobacillus cucumis]
MRIQEYMQETPVKMKEIIQEADQLFAEVRTREIDRIVVTGSGTSFHSGLQTQKLMQHIAGVRVDAYYPFAINTETFLGNSSKTLVVGISQGGSSYSTYNAMKVAKEAGCLTASMAGQEDALIDEVADFILTVQCGEELAGAKTKGFYCTKLNLTLLALQLARETGKLSNEDYNKEISLLEETADQFLKTYDTALQWIETNKEKLAQAKDIRVIGTSEIYGDTLESALKLLETMRIPVTGYEFEEFIHGIYNAVNEDSTIIIFDTGVEKRLEKLVEVLSSWTEHIYVIGSKVEENPQNMKAEFINHPYYKTYEYIIPVQLICGEIPPLRGVDPSIPKDPKFHMKLESKKFNK